MKQSFENILKAIKDSNPNTQNYIIKQLKNINGRITYLNAKIEEKRLIITGKKANTYTDELEKAVAVLKLFGYNEYTFTGVNPKFINWMLDNSLTNTKYNPKLQNKYLLDSFQQAWYITSIDNPNPTYSQVRNTLLTFNENIDNYKKEAKRKLNDLISKIDGTN